MSKNITEAPEPLLIPHLGENPWELQSLEGRDVLPPIDLETRRLYTWLSLPLAAEFVAVTTIDPQQFSLLDAGLEPARQVTPTYDYLHDRFIDLRREMRAGTNVPSSVHAAYDPEDPFAIRWLIPQGTGSGRYIVARTVTSISAPNQHGGRRLTFSGNVLRGDSRKHMQTTVVIPSKESGPETGGRIVRLKDPHGKGAAAIKRQWLGSY